MHIDSIRIESTLSQTTSGGSFDLDHPFKLVSRKETCTCDLLDLKPLFTLCSIHGSSIIYMYVLPTMVGVVDHGGNQTVDLCVLRLRYS